MTARQQSEPLILYISVLVHEHLPPLYFASQCCRSCQGVCRVGIRQKWGRLSGQDKSGLVSSFWNCDATHTHISELQRCKPKFSEHTTRREAFSFGTISMIIPRSLSCPTRLSGVSRFTGSLQGNPQIAGLPIASVHRHTPYCAIPYQRPRQLHVNVFFSELMRVYPRLGARNFDTAEQHNFFGCLLTHIDLAPTRLALGAVSLTFDYGKSASLANGNRLYLFPPYSPFV